MFGIIAIALSAAVQPAAVADAPLKVLPDEIIRQTVTPDDYPIESLKRNEQGTVNFAVVVGTDGRVTSCGILHSSGSETLDSQTCRIMQERLRFRPALDSHGRPTEDRFAGTLNWVLTPL
jgi:protein TonB